MLKSETLRTRLADTSSWFAVIDGARYDDLPAMLNRLNLRARSLFLDQTDADIIKAGPWLLSMDQSPSALGKISILGDTVEFVSWRCPPGENELFRHLRRLNAVALPDGDRVMFRHYDPQVLILLAENLEPQQKNEFFGPAEEVLIYNQSFSRRSSRDAVSERN